MGCSNYSWAADASSSRQLFRNWYSLFMVNFTLAAPVDYSWTSQSILFMSNRHLMQRERVHELYSLFMDTWHLLQLETARAICRLSTFFWGSLQLEALYIYLTAQLRQSDLQDFQHKERYWKIDCNIVLFVCKSWNDSKLGSEKYLKFIIRKYLLIWLW